MVSNHISTLTSPTFFDFAKCIFELRATLKTPSGSFHWPTCYRPTERALPLRASVAPPARSSRYTHSDLT